MNPRDKQIYSQIFDPAVAEEFQAALLARSDAPSAVSERQSSYGKKQEIEALIDEYSYSMESDPEIPQYGYFHEKGDLTWHRRAWIRFQMHLHRPLFKIGKTTVTGLWLFIAAILFLIVSLVLGLALGLTLSSTKYLTDPNFTVAQVASGIIAENGTVILTRETVPNPTLWKFIQYSLDVDRITITDAKVLVTNRSTDMEIAKIEISGRISIVDVANAECNAILTFDGDTKDFSAANLKLFLEINFSVHWNPLVSLPLLRHHSTNFGYNITANNGLWMSDISLISSGTLTVTTVASLTRKNGFNFTPGVHLHVDELKIEGQGLVNSLGSFLNRELGDSQVLLKIFLPFAMTSEAQSLAELSVVDDNGLTLGPVNMHSSRLVLRIQGLGPNPVITLQTDLSIPLAPLNPTMNLTVNGNFNSQSRALILQGELSPWPNPFGLPYLEIDASRLNLTLRQRSHARNRAASFMNRFSVEAYLLTGARLKIPRIPEMSAEVLGTIQNGNLAFYVNNLDVPSIDEVIKSLLGIDVPSLKDKFDITSTRMSMALASSVRTRIALPIDHVMNGMVIGRGMTLVTPAVKVTDLLQPVRDLFPGRDFAIALIATSCNRRDNIRRDHSSLRRPRHEASFSEQFEVFMKSTPFDIDSRLRFLGFGVIARPFAMPVSLALAAELELRMAEQDSLIFHVEGRVQAGQVTIGGSMIGMWYNAFKVNGLHIGNVTAEIGVAPGPVISSIGLGAAIQIGRAEISFLGRVGADLDDSFVYARVQNLYLTDIVQFFKDLNVDFLERIDIEDIPDNIRLNLLLVSFATKNGELQGIPYSKGFHIASDAELLGITATASISSSAGLVADTSFTDLLISFGLRFDNLGDIILDFIERILPFDLPSLDEVLSNIGLPRLNFGNVFSLKSVELSEFSLFRVTKGDFPELSIVIVLAGRERKLTLNLDLKSLGNGLGEILELSNVPSDSEFLSCVVNAHCQDNSIGSVCDHTQSPWRCVHECPQDSVNVENAGCWQSNSTEANPTARRIVGLGSATTFMLPEHVEQYRKRMYARAYQLPVKYNFRTHLLWLYRGTLDTVAQMAYMYLRRFLSDNNFVALKLVAHGCLNVLPDSNGRYTSYKFEDCAVFQYILKNVVHTEIPPNIAIPWVIVAERLQRPPVIHYDVLCLSNYKFARPDMDPRKDRILTEDMVKLAGFLDDYSEDWFYLISDEIEFRGSSIPFLFRRIHQGILLKKLDSNEVGQTLNKICLLLEDMNRILMKMFDKCDPTIFYNKLRPFMNGSKNSLSPQGVLLQMNTMSQDAEEQRIAQSVPRELKEKYSSPTMFAGASAGQSTLMAAIDIFFAVEHPGVEHKSALHAMRDYMPKPHRDYLADLEGNRHLMKDYINENRDKPDLIGHYNKCVEQFAEFRTKHLQIIARYIVSPARALGVQVSGTGGSSVVPFLKSVRDDTRESLVK